MVCFQISGDNFEPNAITDILSLSPSTAWRCGEEVEGRNGLLWICSCWDLRTGYIESLDVSEPLGMILEKLTNKRDALISLKQSFDGLYYKFIIVINMEHLIFIIGTGLVQVIPRDLNKIGGIKYVWDNY